MSKDSHPKHPYGHDPPQEILDKVQDLDTCEREIVYVEHRLAVLQRRQKELDHDLAIFRASIAPISLLPLELLCLILIEVVRDGEYEHISQLSLVSRAWRTALISTPQLWTAIPIVVVNDADRMVNQHRMIQLVLDRNKTQPLDISIDFTSFEPLEDYIVSCIEKALPSLNEPVEVAEWLSTSDWQSMPIVDDIKVFHKRIFDALVGLEYENMARWRSLHLSLPWEEGTYELTLPILQNLFAKPKCQLLELEIDGHPLVPVEEDLNGPWQSQFVSLQHLRCAAPLDLSTLNIPNSTLLSLDCTDLIIYRNLQQIHRFRGLHTLSYKVYPMMEPPAALDRIVLPDLETLRITGAPHKGLLDIFSVPRLSVLCVTFHKDFYIDDVVPESDIFAVPPKVVWTSDDSFSMNDETLYSLVRQCTSATNIIVEDGWKRLLVETIKQNRSLHPGELARLRAIEGCDEFGNKVGDRVDVSIEVSSVPPT